MSKVPAHWLNAPDVVGFTIDAPESKDLDDAIWIEKTEEGFILTVAIAAVSEHVAPESKHDERALDRVETSYGKTKNWPMLPRGLAEKRASLLEGETRRVFTTTLKLDRTLKVLDIQVGLGVLRSSAKLSHADVPKILADPQHELNAQMQLCVHVAQGLVDRRRAAGAFVFYDLNHGWVTTEEGHVRKLKDTQETIGYIVVQEFMILANSAVAELAAAKEIPVLFRNHTAKSHAPDRAELLERLEAGMSEPLRGIETLRKQTHLVMNRADYGGDLKGHYGLNLPAYVHCTSPIRRYADLVTQRQLIAYILNPHAPEYPHSREQIAHLGQVINATLRAREEARRDREKKRASEKAEKALVGDVDLAKLNAKEFERVVKVIVRGDSFVPELVQAYQDRMKDGEPTVMELYLGLLETTSMEEWGPLRDLIVEHLCFHLELAPSIVSMACSLKGWEGPIFSATSSGPDHQRTHGLQAEIRFEDPSKKPRLQRITSRVTWAPSVKVAKQRALIEILAQASGVVPRDWETLPVSDTSDTPSQLAAPLTTDNPISALQEFAQKHRLELPRYEIAKAAGKDHAPKFVSECSFRGAVVKGSPALSKKAAKKLAAEAMVLRLQKDLQ